MLAKIIKVSPDLTWPSRLRIASTSDIVSSVDEAYHYDKASSTDDTISDVEAILKRDGHVKSGDTFIILASMPIQERGRSNTIKVHLVL